MRIERQTNTERHNHIHKKSYVNQIHRETPRNKSKNKMITNQHKVKLHSMAELTLKKKKKKIGGQVRTTYNDAEVKNNFQ